MDIGTIILIVVLVVIVIVVIFLILTKMKGKIVINLDKYDFSPGETISGNLVLKLKKPVDANELSVGLIGTKESSSYSKGAKGGMQKNTNTENVYNFKKPISGEKQYPVGESTYPFQLVVPKDTGKFSTGNQVADTVIKSMQFLSGANSRINWFVTANLAMKGFDINKQVKVNIN
jgi:hypothetical protein